MKLTPINAVHPSAYNPRTADPKRLDLIEISLRKLGFLIPLYADENGELLSGHQRHLVAERIGLTAVPVEYTRPMDLEERRAVNVVFNRATNDLSSTDVPESLTDALSRTDVFALAARLPDLTGDDLYPCLRAETVSVDALVKMNHGRWIDYARNISSTMQRKGVVMPIVATRDLRVVNGIGRLQFLSEREVSTAQVVFISDDQAALADAMLNLLSMDFDIHTRYADLLRHNSFRRVRGVHVTRLGMGTTWFLRVKAAEFDLDEPKNMALWRQVYGDTTLDFGAGRLDDVNLLRTKGIKASAFEPYFQFEGRDEIDIEGARQVARLFLAEVAKGVQWKSIFLNAVFNSVPFHQDRLHIVTLLAALSSPSTVLYTYTSSARNQKVKNATVEASLGSVISKSIQFSLGYETNVLLGEFGSKPKVQKFFTPGEFKDLLKTGFQQVETAYQDSVVTARCAKALPISRARLRQAIEFEFNMPYPDEQRMGLVDEALAAFSQRLGVKL